MLFVYNITVNRNMANYGDNHQGYVLLCVSNFTLPDHFRIYKVDWRWNNGWKWSNAQDMTSI